MSAAPPAGVFLCSAQLGCPANLALTTQLYNWVEANQWPWRDVDAADCIIIVGCSILVEYRRDLVAALQYFAQRYPQKRIFALGCFLDEDRFEAPQVRYVALGREHELDALLQAGARLRSVSPVSTAETDREVQALAGSPRVFDRPLNVVVQTGCLSRCHYCVEPTLFPAVHSVPLAEVVARCRDGIRKGYRNFLIGGADVTSYGHDLGLDVTDLFAALFAEVFDARPDLRVGFKALEPSRFIRHFPVLRRYFETQRIDWIYLPIESGSDRVLQTMNRKYRVEDLLQVVRELRALAPSLRIETDFVVCYPTESREDFEASLRLVEQFDHWNLVPFGRHEHTRASALPDEFTPEERARRCAVAQSMMQQQVRRYRPECRTLDEVPPPVPSGLCVLSRRLGRRLE
jgi:threonylcarbamoyladenosine tRNA methylthiotransferase MtaB